MNILALDLGISTGWALSEHGRLESGTQVFPLDRGESPGIRYLRFRRWLEELVGDPPRVDVIGFEQSHHRGGHATQFAYALTTRIIELAAVRKIQYKAVHSGTLKKWTAGHGRADKAAMRAAVETRWGAPAGASDDEIDALALLKYVEEKLGGEPHGSDHASGSSRDETRDVARVSQEGTDTRQADASRVCGADQ